MLKKCRCLKWQVKYCKLKPDNFFLPCRCCLRSTSRTGGIYIITYPLYITYLLRLLSCFSDLQVVFQCFLCRPTRQSFNPGSFLARLVGEGSLSLAGDAARYTTCFLSLLCYVSAAFLRSIQEAGPFYALNTMGPPFLITLSH